MIRVAALLIALAVGAAPVALEICQLTCASRSMHSHPAKTIDAHAIHHGGGASQPSCHQTGEAGTHILAPPSAACDHNDALIASSLVTTRPDAAASAPLHVITFDLEHAARALVAHRGHITPAFSRLERRLSSPLRI